MDEKKFRETEAKYRELKEKHAKKEISTEEVKAELKQLMVQDETGTYWMLGGKSGKWYRHDGAQWQETDPYEIIKSMKEVEEAPVEKEGPMELGASDQISEEQAEKQEFKQEEEQEEEEEEKNPFESAEVDAADAGGLSYPAFATEAAGTAEGTEGVESEEGAGTIEIGDTTVAADVSPSSFADEAAGTSDAEESPYTTVAADIPSSPFAADAETGKAAGPADAADISVGSNGTERAESPASADNASIDAGGVEDSTYGSYDTIGTYEIDTTEADTADEGILIERGKADDEAPRTEMESFGTDTPDSTVIMDTKKFEYTSSGREEEEPLVAREPAAPEAPVTPKAPAAPALESQDYISCGVCKSRIPPFAIYCTFCGAHQKTLKQPTSVKSMKEESELLVKSINILPFLFFLGGLGLIFGVILGATFGVVNDFFPGLESQFPMILSETRGGIAGGLIFAAIGGIGGFILSAILSTILAGIYNLVAFVFGGIRFKVKR
jgi:hypothetical protein